MNVNNHYVGYADVPFGGTAVKTIESDIAHMKLELKLVLKALHQYEKLQVEVISNLGGIKQSSKYTV